MRQSDFFKFILHEDDIKINGKDPEDAIKEKQAGGATPPPDANSTPNTASDPAPAPEPTAPASPETNTNTEDDTPDFTADEPDNAGTDDTPDFTADDTPTPSPASTPAPDNTSAGADTPDAADTTSDNGNPPASTPAPDNTPDAGTPDAGGDDTPDFTADDGGDNPEGGGQGEDADNPDFTADDSGEDNPEGGDQGEGDAAQDDGASDVPGGSAIDNDIKQAQQDIFSNLGPDQIAIKNKELKEQFITLYTDINEVIDRITAINRKSENITTIEFVTKKFIELRDLVKDDLLFTFDGKSYVQNQIDIHKFLSIYEALTRIIESLGKQKEDEKK